MNIWKEHLIEYIQSLDEEMSFDVVSKLVVIELKKMKEEFLKECNENKSKEVADSNIQSNKNLSMQDILEWESETVCWTLASRIP